VNGEGKEEVLEKVHRNAFKKLQDYRRMTEAGK
jgi:hypothetical protein